VVNSATYQQYIHKNHSVVKFKRKKILQPLTYVNNFTLTKLQLNWIEHKIIILKRM
jgi:hypothetical protein